MILLFQDGAKWRVALENPSYQEFFAALSGVLPLDMEKALQAACSTEEAIFPLWDRDEK